jgi:thermitase
MPHDRRNPALKVSVVILFLCLLLWNLGAGIVPFSLIQDPGTFTPIDTQTSELDLNTTPEPGPTNTPIQTGESIAGDSNRPPLPAIFATGTYVQEELIVRFKPATSTTRIDECFQANQVQIQLVIAELNTYVLRVDSGDIASAFYSVLDCAGVQYVEPNFLLQAADTIPNDPSWGIQYGPVNIRAPQGWDLATGSAAVTIAIVDTGADYGHPDLAGKLLGGYDFVNNDANPQDDNGHGTHVAGIAAASSNNAIGVAGVSWGARIMPVKVLNAAGGGTFANTAAGVVWAIDHGAQVINLSLGGTGPSAILEDAINYARSQGAVVVAAAGNSGSNFVLYPARYPNVIAVARTNSANGWDGSNYGPEIDLSAPGTSIYSTIIGGYDYKSGSSMSTGFVSGLVAILMSIPGNASPDGIEFQMESTALDIEFTGWDEYTGAGLIQMDAAIQFALQSINPVGAPGDLSARDGSRLIQVVPTNTPSPTWTVTALLPSPSPTDTPATESPSPSLEFKTMTSLPTIEENSEVEALSKAGNNNLFLPCIGILFIVLGVILFIHFKRKYSPRRSKD